MKTIKFAGLLSLSAILLLASGCGKNKAVQAAEDMADKACACKDAKCVADLQKESTEIAKNAKDITSEGDAKAFAAAGMKMTECMTKLATSTMPAMPK